MDNMWCSYSKMKEHPLKFCQNCMISPFHHDHSNAYNLVVKQGLSVISSMTIGGHRFRVLSIFFQKKKNISYRWGGREV